MLAPPCFDPGCWTDNVDRPKPHSDNLPCMDMLATKDMAKARIRRPKWPTTSPT